MAKSRRKKRLTSEGKLFVAGVILTVILVPLLIFFFWFRTNDIKVAGNTRYEDSKIIEYVQNDAVLSNTFLTSMFRKHIVVEDIPFVDSFDVEVLDRNSIRVYVNEKQIVGYVVENTGKLYFDKDGYILEAMAMTEEEIQEIQNFKHELELLQIEAERQEYKEQFGSDKTDTGSEDALIPIPAPTAEPNAGAQAQQVSDVPKIIGLNGKNLVLGQQIAVADTRIFNTILSLSRMASKYEIMPEIVWFDREGSITLIYENGRIHCQLGPDTLLEEKMTRVSNILPHLKNEVGILHLEEYSADTENIIFSKESEYTLKLKIG